ncbi:BglG family transcription antiterminator [Collinsella vaginalis]|uniref:BglG family transcription antiterminator n=1 Tax=Collinsella vaginalis TaxID=1870987 RepID=UPI000A2682F7|nr:PTS sugar transporter subunit IIA [Collinsella vaginalis]
MSDDEVGYLALSFALALEQQRKRGRRAKSVLIVCASGLGSAQLLAMRCREQLGDYLGAIGTCDVAQLSRVDFSDIDCVFATVPISSALPVPVYEVSLFFEEGDAANLRRVLETADQDTAELERYFDRRLFFAHIDVESRDEVLDVLCERACKVLDITSDLRASVAAREEVASTAYGNRVAMPHPLKAISSTTAVAVGLLERPIRWGSKDVQVVFLVLVSQSTDEDLKPFYEAMLSFSTSREDVDALLADRSYEQLIARIRPTAPHDGRGGGRI